MIASAAGVTAQVRVLQTGGLVKPRRGKMHAHSHTTNACSCGRTRRSSDIQARRSAATAACARHGHGWTGVRGMPWPCGQGVCNHQWLAMASKLFTFTFTSVEAQQRCLARDAAAVNPRTGRCSGGRHTPPAKVLTASDTPWLDRASVCRKRRCVTRARTYVSSRCLVAPASMQT